jgi:two-component system, LuxR family, response regulator FixJ
MPSEPTVFVVDDNEAVRDALFICLTNDGFRVECFESGESFLDAVTDEMPGCLLLDQCMPGMDGRAVQEELNRRRYRIPIVFMTAFGTIRDSVAAVKAGALDFLEKPVARLVLLERIQTALAWDEKMRTDRESQSSIRSRYERLSPREREIMEHISEGKSSKQIAKTLGISPRTVDAHRARLMVKMRASSLAELGALHASCSERPEPPTN